MLQGLMSVVLAKAAGFGRASVLGRCRSCGTGCPEVVEVLGVLQKQPGRGAGHPAPDGPTGAGLEKRNLQTPASLSPFGILGL